MSTIATALAILGAAVVMVGLAIALAPKEITNAEAAYWEALFNLHK